MIAKKLNGYSLYEKIPTSVKAEVFGFEIDDSSGDLKWYMQIVKVLGVRMSQDEMFEDYQKVYEEMIKRQEEDGRIYYKIFAQSKFFFDRTYFL